MALKFATGFECGINPLTVGGGTTTITADTTGPNGGTYALKLVNTGTFWTLGLPNWTAAASSDEVLIQFAGKRPAVTPSNNIFLSIQVSTSNFLVFVIQTNDTIAVYRGASQLATTTLLGTTASAVFSINLWHTFWFRVKPATGATGIVEIWQDSVQVLNLTSTITCSNALDTVRGATILRYNNTNDTEWLDDVVLCDSTTGLGSSGVPEPLKLESAYVPNGDSSVTWSRSAGATDASCVDEIPFSASDFISTSGVGNADVLDFTDRSASPVIRGVMVWALAKNPDGGAASLQLGLRSVSTDSLSAAQALTSVDSMVYQAVESDPNTGAAWTNSGLNAAKIKLLSA